MAVESVYMLLLGLKKDPNDSSGYFKGAKQLSLRELLLNFENKSC